MRAQIRSVPTAPAAGAPAGTPSQAAAARGGRRFNRRLAAVLIADVAGYARLMDRDETGTHRRLHEIRLELVEPAIGQHGGQIIRSTGDGLLVHFPSATEALRCAVGIQRAMAERNAGVASSEQIRFRIGLNVADILFDEDQDIAGGGVNLAARLESLAEPGGICISRTLREHIQEDLKVTYLDAGRRRVKNIRRPVRVYRVLTAPLSPLASVRAGLAAWLSNAWNRVALAASAAAITVTTFSLAAPHEWTMHVVRAGGEPQVPALVAPRIDRATWDLAASARARTRANFSEVQCASRPLS